MVVTPAPEALRLIVPVAVIDPSVMAPVTAKVPPIVAFPVTARSVPTEREVPAARVVVEAMDPGATKVAGMLKVIVSATVVVAIWLADPKRFILLAMGFVTPLSEVRKFSAEVV
jgi:hypothetical protein